MARPLRDQMREGRMLKRTMGRLGALLRDDLGQDLIEYALLASLIAVAAIVALRDAGTEVAALWSDIAARIASAL